MKVTKSLEKINPFGGFNFCVKLLKDIGIPALFDRELGSRGKKAEFKYSDILQSHLAIYLNGGDCTEDINEHLRGHLSTVKDLNVCSADTILRGIKELSTPEQTYTGASGVTHHFNINQRLNGLLLKTLKKTGQLNTLTGHTLDYDNQVIPTEKYDARKTYKKCEGYQPGVATIGKAIVHVEGRNGNSQAKYQQKETLERIFSSLKAESVRIKNFRADSASYQKDVVALVEQQAENFYIRAIRCAHLETLIGQFEDGSWTKIRLGSQEMEVADISQYVPFGGQAPYRLVVTRIKRKDKQADLFSGKPYTYRGILTNDHRSSSKHVVSFYNQRGSAERVFDTQNNDFGWSKLPCSFLNENTSFMILTAIYANLYQFMIARFSEKLDWLGENFRLKKFIFRFIVVAAKWIRSGGQYILKLYTDKDYVPLLT
jgi:hypothetical protein